MSEEEELKIKELEESLKTAKKRSYRRKSTRHHRVPRSRGGSEIPGNIWKLPRRYHEAYHHFFGNLTPEEAIRYIREVFLGEKNKWTVEELYFTQLDIQRESMMASNQEQSFLARRS